MQIRILKVKIKNILFQKMFIKISNVLYEDHLKDSEDDSYKTFVPNNHQLKKKRKVKDQKKCC